MNEPLVSVIIPVKDTEKTIEKCINSVLNLDYLNFEIIVVDDASIDRTSEILKNYYQKIKVIINIPSLGPSESRNIASKEAKGEYLAFTDGDCIVDKQWLKELMAGFNLYPQAIACGGVQELPQDATDFERRVFLFMKKSGFISDYMRKKRNEKIIKVNHNPSCNVIYKRNILLQEGGFLEDLWPGEDVELDYRLKRKGYKLFFNPKAVVYHYRPANLNKFCLMMFKYGFAQGFLVRRYGIFRKVQLLPLFNMILLFLTLSLLFFKKTNLLIFLLFLLFITMLIYFTFYFPVLFLAILGIIFWHIGFLRGLFLRLKQG